MVPSASYFDLLAMQYDRDFTGSMTGISQRSEVHFYLRPLLDRQPLNILELNCGTGEDARWMAKFGHRVTAMDISEKMIAVAGSKPNPHEIKFVQSDINRLAEDFADRRYDLVVSDFGGLNCLQPPELETFASNLERVLVPGGKAVLVLISNYSLAEMLYFLVRADLKKMTRRMRGKAMSGELAVHYYSPRTIRELFRNFSVQKKGIGIFTPPSYYERLWKKMRGKLRIKRREGKAEQFAGTLIGADHVLYLLEKNEGLN